MYVVVEKQDKKKKMKKNINNSVSFALYYMFVATITFSMVSLEMGIDKEFILYY